ncbi:MAG: leucyl/phenylalanyl-tRNA--protein transferase [Fimbriimonadales bacterium]
MGYVPTPDELYHAYSTGWFPMAEESGEIGWYKPHVRAIIPIENFQASHSLRKSARKMEWEFDRDFANIMDECANREETWISREIKDAYVRLFDLGYAHCCGTYRNGSLIGGVYCVAFGNALFAESMFHIETDAGKVALWKLVEKAGQAGVELFEVQFLTPHLATLGAIEIEEDEYFTLLEKALR